jgi:queuine/archaeosine tRNA-ribosyltransferase
LYFLQELMRKTRKAIEEGRFEEFKGEFVKIYK